MGDLVPDINKLQVKIFADGADLTGEAAELAHVRKYRGGGGVVAGDGLRVCG